MSKIGRIIMAFGVSALVLAMLSCICLAADYAGYVKVFENNSAAATTTVYFSDGDELNDLLDDYDEDDMDVYIELYKDLNLGGSSGDPIYIEGDADVYFNLKGHRIYRSFSDDDYYGDGFVMEISPDRDDAEVWIYSDNSSDRTKNNPTADKGIISGGRHDDEGGGIVCDGEGIIHINNVSVTGNSSEEDGGGIYVSDTDCILILENGAAVSGNSSEEWGGGICLYWGRLEMEAGSKVSGNSAQGRGGGVCVYGGLAEAQLLMKGGEISGNQVTNPGLSGKIYGGGIYCAGYLEMTGGTVCNNRAEDMHSTFSEQVCGGGICLDSSSNNRINGIKVNGNFCEGLGGGICFLSGDDMMLTNSKIYGNKGGIGGGLYMCDDAEIDYAEIYDNEAYYSQGGGAYVGSKQHFYQCQFYGNSAPKGEGGGLYVTSDFRISRCEIRDNWAKVAGGVYVAASAEFRPDDWVKIYRNFNYKQEYSNLYLYAYQGHSAYLNTDETRMPTETLIYVTSADNSNDEEKRLSEDPVLADRWNELESRIWYDSDEWKIDTHYSYLRAVKNDPEECYKVNVYKEWTTNTAGDTAAPGPAVKTYYYQPGKTVYKGTVWGESFDNVSYDAVYDDNPKTAADKTKTAVKIVNGSNQAISALYYKDIHGEIPGKYNLTDNTVMIDQDWNINCDVNVYIRCRDQVNSATVDIPKLALGEALPEKAQVTHINTYDISDGTPKIEPAIVWENATDTVQPGKTYKGTVIMTFDFYDKDIQNFHYLNYYDFFFFTCNATYDGNELTGTKVARGVYEYKLKFEVETEQPVLDSIEWPTGFSTTMNANTGEYAPEDSLPSQLFVNYHYMNGDTRVDERKLMEAKVSYTEDQAAAKAAILNNSALNPAKFFVKAGEYGFTYTVKIPESFDTTEFTDSAGKAVTVTVTGSDADTPEGLPELDMAAVYSGSGIMTCSFTHPDPMGTTEYYARVYEASVTPSGSLTDDGNKLAGNEITFGFSAAEIQAADADHKRISRIYCVEAQAFETVAEAGTGEPAAKSSAGCWYLEVAYEPATYKLEVKYAEDTAVFTTGTWTADDTAANYIEGETVKLTPLPSNDGNPVENMKFLRWTTDADGVIASGHAADNPLSITMPAQAVTITAVYAPMVTEVSFTVTDDTTNNSVEATLKYADGSTGTADATLAWTMTEEMHNAVLTLAEDAAAELFFAPGVGVKNGGNAVAGAGVEYDDQMKGTLVAQFGFKQDPPALTDATCTPPEARELYYEEGKSHSLVNPGTTGDGIMMYALGNQQGPTGDYTTEIPEAEEVGPYYVWYYVAGNQYHNDSGPAVVSVSIQKKPTDEDTDDDDEDDEEPESGNSWFKTVLLNIFTWGFLGRILQWIRLLHIF